jgi:phospholipid-transporting ATPase
MAGNPQNNDLLLDLDDQGRHYGNPGRPPVTSEDEYAHRMSSSYDDFVGAGPSSQESPALDPPQTFTTTHQTYSQSSGLNNYQPYYDDYPDEGHSTTRYQYGQGDDPPEVPRDAGNRQSTYSMQGVVGRVKSALGMNPQYSEMDLPLTETRPRDAIAGAEDTASINGRPAERRKSGGGFKFGFGRRKVDPSTLGPRVLHLNNPPANSAHKYVDNHVSTAKYNIATFVPKFLYEQFSKYANIFFLFTAALQQIPNVSPTNRYTTIGPLIVVLLVSAGKELVEDWKRKTQDKELNRSKTKVLIGSSFEETQWINVRVGDIVRVQSEEPFPADLVLVASSEPEGLCYIETANLDGETNLKIKQAIPETADLVSPGELSRLSGKVRSEQPNSSLYTYEGTLTMDMGGGEKELPLSPDQLLLRGATLRNTPWIHGVVVFTGHETKLMRNATATPIKRTAVERQLNIQIIMLVSILLLLSLVSSTGDVIKQVCCCLSPTLCSVLISCAVYELVNVVPLPRRQ